MRKKKEEVKGGWRMNIRAGDRRHPEALPYRCCLSTLAGFGRLCRAGPARTMGRITEQNGDVNCLWIFVVIRISFQHSRR